MKIIKDFLLDNNLMFFCFIALSALVAWEFFDRKQVPEEEAVSENNDPFKFIKN